MPAPLVPYHTGWRTCSAREVRGEPGVSPRRDDKNGKSSHGSEDGHAGLSRRHVRFGWWALFTFLLLGVVLDSLHGLKVGWYLEVANSARRLSWTLAHAHGTLLAVVNVIFGVTLDRAPAFSARSRQVASRCLLGATVIMPAGFLIGGLLPLDGDPGWGIFLVPVGGGLLAVSVLLVAMGFGQTPED
jgi:hypothetical protein